MSPGAAPDGYHDLETVFQLVDLCDEIDIEVRAGWRDRRVTRRPRIRCCAALADEDDLTVRAARLLQAAERHAARRQTCM